MADIEVAPLSEWLDDDEVGELATALEELGAPRLPKMRDEGEYSVEGLDEEALGEVLDRLDAQDLACDIYLPVEFEGTVEVAGAQVGSAQALIEVLQEVREELDLAAEEEEEEEEEEDEEDEEGELMEANLRQVWKVLFEGAQAAVDRRLALRISQ